jgi:short-chain Z-isoprenyl diphosphate synthase
MARWWDRVTELIDRLRPTGLVYSTYEQQLVSHLDKDKLPNHVAVLADGNRRWARQNAPGQPLVAGYREGANRLMEFCGWCDEVGIPVVTLWVLSTDNLDRSGPSDVQPLLEVIATLVEEVGGRWRVQAVGDLSLLPDDIVARLRAAQMGSVERDSMHVNVAVAYGGRHELTDAVRSLIAEEAAAGGSIDTLAARISDERIAAHLYTKGQPDPDLIIRTSGEQRLSGFLLWQSAHSEFYFCEALWPDFRRVDFYRALRSYEARERRFGH